jgi:hypothetical protein
VKVATSGEDEGNLHARSAAAAQLQAALCITSTNCRPPAPKSARPPASLLRTCCTLPTSSLLRRSKMRTAEAGRQRESKK